MGILDQAGIQRIQENLISKSPQNGAAGERLSKAMVIARYIALITKSQALDSIIGWVEDQQLVIDGWSRRQFLESLKYSTMPKEEETLGKKE